MDHHCHIAPLMTAGRGETALWFVGMPGLTKPTPRVGAAFSNRQSGDEAFKAWKAGLLLDSAHELADKTGLQRASQDSQNTVKPTI